MTTISWNCQELRSDLTVRRLEEMCREHFPDFLFLLETKNSSAHVSKLQGSLGYDHFHLVNPVGLSGGLALFWKSSYVVDILSSDDRLIDVRVIVGTLSYYMSFVYGDPVQGRRRLVWEKLINIGLNRQGAWFLTGDFNELMNNSEKVGGPVRQESTFYSFRSMVRDCRIKEIPNSGNKLSWGGWRDTQTPGGGKNVVWIQCRLDRAFGNAEWFRVFPKTHLQYLEMLGSDHRPILSTLATENMGRVGRFMFDKRWGPIPQALEAIRRGWNFNQNGGNMLVSDRISACRKELSKWKRRSNGNSKESYANCGWNLSLK